MQAQTMDQIQAYLSEVETVVQTLLQLHGEVSQLQGARAISVAVDNRKQLAQVESNLTLLAQQMDKVEKLVFDKTGKLSVEAASDLVMDINIRLQRTRELHAAWRRMIALQEFAEATGQFTEVVTEGELTVTREQAVEAVEKAQRFYLTQLELTAALVPVRTTTSSILVVSA